MTRQVTDVKHKIVAIGSRTESKAKDLLVHFETGLEQGSGDKSAIKDCKTYGDYEQLYQDAVRSNLLILPKKGITIEIVGDDPYWIRIGSRCDLCGDPKHTSLSERQVISSRG